MTEIPMVVINEFKIWKRELLFYHFGKFGFDGFCPLAYEDNEFVDVLMRCYAFSLTSRWEVSMVIWGVRSFSKRQVPRIFWSSAKVRRDWGRTHSA